eukprot:symbB.v1.2.013667.t1/scaffold973.1/size147933/12
MVGGQANGHAWKPCIQCGRRALERPALAFFGEAVAKPVFQPCRHGPFCDRCRAAVGRCILPACVCRALLECWKEEEWPEAGPEDAPAKPQSKHNAAAAKWLESLEASRRVQPRGLQPAAALASAAADENQAALPAVPQANGSSSSAPAEAAVFKRRVLADGKEEKIAFRFQKRNGAEEKTSAELSAAQVAATVAAEANQERLLEEELRDRSRSARAPRFQAQLPNTLVPEQRREATSRQSKKPRLIAAYRDSDGSGSD